jgi:hypothetical protein
MKEVKDFYNKSYKSLKKSKTSKDVKISYTHESAESILWKWYITKRNLYVQCNPHQNFNDIVHRDRKINSKLPMEAQKTLKN